MKKFERRMALILITGSTEELGKAAALALIDDGHDVVLPARNASRAAGMGDVTDRAFGVVIGDLGTADETPDVANQVNAIGRMDAVIHNAGIYIDPERVATPEGHARTLAVNVLAPYVLTAEIGRPARLIYIGSGMHGGGDASLRDIDWTARGWRGVQACSDSKLFVAALAFAVCVGGPTCAATSSILGRCPPGWAGPTHRRTSSSVTPTQVWLAVSDERDATGSGGYWYHRRRQAPAPAVSDVGFQDALLEQLSRMTAVRSP